MHMLRKAAGFTLIELMIVVVVISILAAVALPSYQAYVTRGKLVDGTSILADSRVKMEQYFQDKRIYGATGTTCPVAVGVSEYFSFSCVITADTFTVTAASKAGGVSATAGDYTYTINELNAKSTTKYKGATQTGKACWLIKGTEC